MADLSRSIASDIRGLLEAESPRSYCVACLAFGFDVSLGEAWAMACTLAAEPAFVRRQDKCDNCGRIVETVARRANPAA